MFDEAWWRDGDADGDRRHVGASKPLARTRRPASSLRRPLIKPPTGSTRARENEPDSTPPSCRPWPPSRSSRPNIRRQPISRPERRDQHRGSTAPSGASSCEARLAAAGLPDSAIDARTLADIAQAHEPGHRPSLRPRIPPTEPRSQPSRPPPQPSPAARGALGTAADGDPDSGDRQPRPRPTRPASPARAILGAPWLCKADDDYPDLHRPPPSVLALAAGSLLIILTAGCAQTTATTSTYRSAGGFERAGRRSRGRRGHARRASRRSLQTRAYRSDRCARELINPLRTARQMRSPAKASRNHSPLPAARSRCSSPATAAPTPTAGYWRSCTWAAAKL